MPKKRTSKKTKFVKKQIRKRWKTASVVTVVILLLLLNVMYQVFMKPTEIVRFLGFGTPRTVTDTWDSYGNLFKKHETELMTSDFLAALAQAESGGNPIAGPGWKLKLTADFSRIYAPQSSSLGLYQITDGFYKRAKNYCIKEGKVVRKNPWFKFKNCWTRLFYSRLVPSHAIEMTSAYLTLTTDKILKKYKKKGVRRAVRQTIAAITHLCGSAVAKSYVRRNFRARKGRKCGSHNLSRYIKRIKAYQKAFIRARNMSRG